MGTCGNDYTTTAKVGYVLLGAATSTSTTPTTSQACYAIQAAEDLIDGYLHKDTAYTTVPQAIQSIALRLTVHLLRLRQAWEVTEGASSDSDLMGSASYDADYSELIPKNIRDDLDEYIKWKAYREDTEVPFKVQNVEDDDLSFDEDWYQ